MKGYEEVIERKRVQQRIRNVAPRSLLSWFRIGWKECLNKDVFKYFVPTPAFRRVQISACLPLQMCMVGRTAFH